MAMKLQIFTIKTVRLSAYLFSSNYLGFCSDNYYPQVLLTECKYIERNELDIKMKN